jgi:hypothetical protein
LAVLAVGDDQAAAWILVIDFRSVSRMIAVY